MKSPKKNITINTLALMIKGGFDGVDKKFNTVDKSFDSVNKRFNRIDRDIQDLKQGQEEIKLKLDNVAYRFELKELENRVTILEKQLQRSS